MQASCLCKSVQFSFPRAVGEFVYCHCRSCRKASGSAFGANISVPVAELRFACGENNIGVFESSPGKRRHFCKTCASPLFTKVGDNPEYLRVRLGVLDSDFNQLPSAHIFMNHKASWHDPEHRMQCFGEWPDPSAVSIAGSRQPEKS
ncbi:MAG: GFA family protein [Granulosicoccaceae bacterium]